MVFAQRLAQTIVILLVLCPAAAARELILEDLINEALHNNPQLKAAAARSAAMEQRISQSGSLMDPMLSLGYENDGTSKYTYGEMANSQWMIGLSQTFPFPGKLSLQEQTAGFEAANERAMLEAQRRESAYKVVAAYYDLLLSTKETDILHSLQTVAAQVEKTALSQYATGMMPQEEVLMAQSEKYMLMERLAMADGQKATAEALLRQQTGRGDDAALGKPQHRPPSPFAYSTEELLQKAWQNSPELKAAESLSLASQKMLARARKEAWPDVTVMASYTKKGSDFEDMLGLTASIPLPVFYSRKQGAGINEASWNAELARQNIEARKLAIAAEIRDNLAMIKAADNILSLYRSALQPKARQQVDAALALLATGKLNATQALTKLKAPYEYELNAWRQQVQREKAIARIKAITGELEASK